MCRNCGTTNNMQMQLTSFLLLFLLCNGLCSDIDQGKRAIEDEVLRSLLTSKVKASRHIAPLWQLPLQDVCRMVNGLGDSWLEAWANEEAAEDTEVHADYEQRVSGTLLQMLEEMHDIQNLCRVLQPRELQDEQEYLELEQNSDSPLKRKSPYILKRQLRTNKSRRPYILKRSVIY
ncbi:neurotensin/neuromedin N [Danio rerio]|uniref:Neurotensin/neuromedin N n=1 Tax=Danio rerio TaxID=7955 RepID=A0A0A7H8E2_DANRE|nr:neurotensin/neuromedin N [Danio rerio]XP_021328936.1 neurotensin/neuromedin N [Danio rerio]AIZ00848.1 neurotensin [Danio rerio]|eukprot:XP_017207567.1 neurotensin/neuromedin N [Danio rerio]